MSPKKILSILVFFACLSAACCAPSNKWQGVDYLQGRLIVSFTNDFSGHSLQVGKTGIVESGISSLDEIFTEYRVNFADRLVPDGILNRLKSPPDFYRTYVLNFSKEYPVTALIDKLSENALVSEATPDVLYRTFRSPNDNLWSQQWDKRIVGADDVWDISVGSPSVICAGIDIGVDWNHPDLTPILWVNPQEDLDGDGVRWIDNDYPGDYDDLDGEDNDNNGYVDDFLGWDFIRSIAGCATGEDCDQREDNNMMSVNDHGTHVGGIMAARGNNNIGVAGMSWVGTLMALRAGYEDTDGNGFIPESGSIPAILYATAEGAKVINMSYGGPSSGGQANDALQAAWAEGCILFAASGNDGSTNPQYPANFENVIAVNATNSQDRLVGWSNRGTWTDLCSPGDDITATVINGYGSLSGTSMASPNAAGVAALIWSLLPNFTNAQIRDLIFDNAQNINSLNPNVPPNHMGHGRVDAQRAIAAIYPRLEITSISLNDAANGDGDHRLERGELGHLVLTIQNLDGWADGDDISCTVSSDDPNLTITNETFFLGDLSGGQSANNNANPVHVTASQQILSAYWANFSIAYSSPSGFSSTSSFTLRIERGDVLVIDDDGTDGYEQYYLTAVANAALAADIWTSNLDGVVSAQELMQYSTVIWSCGNQSTQTLTTTDQSNLTQFLQAGKNLILVGQNIDNDNTVRNSAFYSDYIHAQTDNSTGDRQLTGVSGDIISNGMTLLLQGGSCGGNGLVGPSRIVPVNGAVPMFTYNPGGVGAIHYEGAYRVAYFAFALEAACGLSGTNSYNDVIWSLLHWSQNLDANPEQPRTLPQTIALHGNYPNPFNPATTISFDVAGETKVSLKVFDITGREVKSLLNETVSAGSHQIVFDASGLSSGIYLTELKAGNVTATAKMVLLK